MWQCRIGGAVEDLESIFAVRECIGVDEADVDLVEGVRRQGVVLVERGRDGGRNAIDEAADLLGGGTIARDRVGPDTYCPKQWPGMKPRKSAGTL